jgi:hypothetical protein
MKKRIMCLLFVLCLTILVIGGLSVELIGKSAEFNQSVVDSVSTDKIVLSTFNIKVTLPEIPEKMMVYKTVDPYITGDDITQLKDVFNIDGKIINRGKQYVVREGNPRFKVNNLKYGADYNKVLEVFKQPGTGYLRFTNIKMLGREEKARNLPSEDEAINIAEEFLKRNNLLPDNTFFNKVGYYEFMEFDSNGLTIDSGVSAISVSFGFTIGDIKVEGPGAKVSVTFGDDSEIISVLKCWREITPNEKHEIIPFQDVYDSFKERWPPEATDSEQKEQADILTTVNIREVYLTYYAESGCIPQSYIEPVYVFRGDYIVSTGDVQDIEDCPLCGDNFIMIIPAIL